MRKCEHEDGYSIPEYPLIPTLSLYFINELHKNSRCLSPQTLISNERGQK